MINWYLRVSEKWLNYPWVNLQLSWDVQINRRENNPFVPSTRCDEARCQKRSWERYRQSEVSSDFYQAEKHKFGFATQHSRRCLVCEADVSWHAKYGTQSDFACVKLTVICSNIFRTFRKIFLANQDLVNNLFFVILFIYGHQFQIHGHRTLQI